MDTTQRGNCKKERHRLLCLIYVDSKEILQIAGSSTEETIAYGQEGLVQKCLFTFFPATNNCKAVPSFQVIRSRCWVGLASQAGVDFNPGVTTD